MSAGLGDLEMSRADVSQGLQALRTSSHAAALFLLYTMFEKVNGVPVVRGIGNLEELMAEPTAPSNAELVAALHLAALGYPVDDANADRWIELLDDFLLKHSEDFIPILGATERPAMGTSRPVHQKSDSSNHCDNNAAGVDADDDNDDDGDSRMASPAGPSFDREVAPVETPERYVDLGAITRTRLLLSLFEKVAFDFESAYSSLIEGMEADALRHQPFGYDARHNAYWLVHGGPNTTRVYREPDPAAVARAERADKLAAQKAEKGRAESEKVEKKKRREAARKEREAKMQEKWRVRPAVSRRTRASVAASQENVAVATRRSVEAAKPAEDLPDSAKDDDDKAEAEEEVVKPIKDATNERGESHKPGFSFNACKSWELVANDSTELRAFIESCLAGKRRQAHERHLRTFLEDEVLPAFEASERKRARANERRDREDYYTHNPKKSARVLALEQRREEEERILREREERERERMEEERRRKAERKAEIEREEKEQRRLARMEKREAHLEAENTVATKSPAAATLVATQGEDGPVGEKSPPSGEPAQSNELTSPPATRIVSPAKLTNRTADFDNESALPDYFNWECDEKGFPNRHLDKIRIATSSGELSKLEVIDNGDGSQQALEIWGELKAAPDSGKPNSTVRISGLKEWCIEYGSDPAIWIRSGKAWYRLHKPHKEYRSFFFSARRKLELCNRLYLLSQTFVSEPLTLSKALEQLSNPGDRLRAYKEGDLLIEGDFILSQMEGLDSNELKSSPLMRELAAKVEARRKKRQNPGKYKVTTTKRPRKPTASPAQAVASEKTPNGEAAATTNGSGQQSQSARLQGSASDVEADATVCSQPGEPPPGDGENSNAANTPAAPMAEAAPGELTSPSAGASAKPDAAIPENSAGHAELCPGRVENTERPENESSVAAGEHLAERIVDQLAVTDVETTAATDGQQKRAPSADHSTTDPGAPDEAVLGEWDVAQEPKAPAAGKCSADEQQSGRAEGTAANGVTTQEKTPAP